MGHHKQGSIISPGVILDDIQLHGEVFETIVDLEVFSQSYIIQQTTCHHFILLSTDHKES